LISWLFTALLAVSKPAPAAEIEDFVGLELDTLNACNDGCKVKKGGYFSFDGGPQVKIINSKIGQKTFIDVNAQWLTGCAHNISGYIYSYIEENSLVVEKNYTIRLITSGCDGAGEGTELWINRYTLYEDHCEVYTKLPDSLDFLQPDGPESFAPGENGCRPLSNGGQRIRAETLMASGARIENAAHDNGLGRADIEQLLSRAEDTYSEAAILFEQAGDQAGKQKATVAVARIKASYRQIKDMSNVKAPPSRPTESQCKQLNSTIILGKQNGVDVSGLEKLAQGCP
jgi:hypothetical protein